MKRGALILTLIFVASTYLAMLAPSQISGNFTEDLEPALEFASLNSPEVVTIGSHPDGVTNAFKVNVADNHAVRNISVNMSPIMLPRSEAISFTDSTDFNQTGAISQGIDFNNSGLQVSAIDEYWSFEGSNNLPTGWTSTNSNNGRINTMSCGTNGSSARSLTLRHGQSYVTSNVVDLSSLSNGQIAFWMREGQSGCGEDPDSSEHLYLQYKKSSGSWGQITYFNAGLGSPYYTPRNVAYSLPSDAFHSNFQFRFYMPRGSGTCCDWWFVDDVRLTKPGGEGNWSTPAFGPGAQNQNFRSLPGPYGLMSIDTDAPANSVTWSVVDGVTGDVIDGYYDRSGTWSDLGGIDWEIHSSIRLKVVLEAMGTGSVTKVNGIHVQGRFVNSFDDNPSDWNLVATSWDGDSIVGDGEAYSPTFLFRQPISRIASNVTVTGGGELQAAVDGGPWGVISAAGINNLDSPAHKIQLRWSGGGQQFDLLHFDVEFQGAGLPTNPRIDLSLDGSDEWSIDNESIGIWGWQNRLADGNLSKTATFPGQHNVEFWIPKDSTGDLLFEISPNSSVGVSNLEMQLLVGGNLVNSWTYGSGDESRTFRIQDSDRANFVSELTNAQPIWSEDGIEYVAAEMMLDAPGGQVTLAGLAMPHQPTATLHFEPETDFMLNFNQLTASMTASSGWKSVPISMGWETPAAMEVTLTELVSDLATEITLSQASNLSSTLSPTWQMFEISHNISVLEGELAAIRYDLEGGNEAITYTAWYGAQPLPNNTLVGDVDAVILPSEFNEGNYSVPVNSSGPGICCDVNPTFIWSLDSSWDDDDLVTLSVRSIMGDGLISLPWVHQFGVGPLQGVENDLLIRDWRVLNDLGLEVSEEASYLKMNSNITVQVDFGFEGIDSIFAPRSDDIEVRLLQDGIVHALTTELIHGVATFVTTTPMTTGDVEYSVEFTPLKGGDDVTSILLNQTFEIDSVAPQVISQSVATHDHLEPSLSQTLTFELYDLPTLPTDVSLMLWREWQDDTNGNNQPDSSEFHPQSMIIPQNLSHIQGNYSFTFDDSYGLEGDRVAGYLVGSDPAGNEIIGGGSDELNSHLFIYQLMTDEAPTITREGAGWADGPRDWLHPSPTYGIVMPFEEANGFSDIDQINFNLAGNSIIESLPVRWNSTNGVCSTTSSHLELVGCQVRSRNGNLTAFSSELEVQIDFKLAWDLPDEGDLRREPDIEVVDRAGQGDWMAYPELRWRFSTDLRVESESIQVELSEGTRSADGAWVAPNSNITISGRVSFHPSRDLPADDMKVKVLLGGEGVIVRGENGWWSATLKAPSQSGPAIVLTFELTDLPPQARDITDTGLAILYITVDGTPPMPAATVGPREGSEIPVSSLSSLVVELQINELEQLDSDSLTLHWLVTHGSNPYGDEIASGNSGMILPGYNAAGSAIPVRATIDLMAEIPAAMLSSELTFHVWVTGSDLVGNQMVSDIQFNSEGSPFASWQIQQLKAEILIQDSDLSYSRSGEIGIGEAVMVTVQVHNLGEAYGAAELTLVEVDSEGVRRVITPVAAIIGVNPGESSEGHIDWVPESEGYFHIVVMLEGEEVAIGEVVTAVQPDDSGVLGDLESRGFTIEWLGILGGLFILLTAVVVIAMRTGGAPDEDWFEDEVDATSTVEAGIRTGGTSTAEVAAEWATMQARAGSSGNQQAAAQWTPEQIAAWQNQQMAQGQQTEWTPEQIAWWQQQQQAQYQGQQQYHEQQGYEWQ